MKILIVDDEAFVLKLFARQLANLGFTKVIAHERAHDALALLETGAEAVDLIFCDLQMPGMDGVEFVRHLTRIGYAGRLVLVSGEDERILQTAKKLAKAHKLDVLGALHKPVSQEQLSALLASGKLSRPAAGAHDACKTYAPDELRRAVAGGELVNYYQPKVRVADGKLAGVETLVRWQHPQDGLVLPDQFICTAEKHGLIDDLTRTVLTGAVHQASRWRAKGMRPHVAVNVSMENLTALEFPNFIADLAAAAGVPLSSIALEVTESQVMKNPLAVLDILTRLRLKRIGLSIDDFGTGYSSLAQLRDIPFDELKVDRGFIHGACREDSLRAIFNASLGMAQQLGMKTVAEGVEDRDDWDFVRASGCTLAQGYFIARPMPADNLAGWIADWETRRGELVAASA